MADGFPWDLLRLLFIPAARFGPRGFRVASSWKFRRFFSLFGRRVSNELRRAAYDDDVSALLLLLLLATERDNRGGDASSTTTTTTTHGP